MDCNRKIQSQALVSVVVPTYNRAYCLQRCVNSVLEQSYPHVEVLLVDDGSQDGTEDLVKSRYGGDDRVRYVFQANRGVAAARNRGFSLAQGEFVALLDSDDVWKPWKLELQVAVMAHLPEVGMVWTDMEAVDATGTVCDRK
ncbi:MAG: glycosyltransferase, partial [Nitrospira sp.]|nr:glycosyltransferase [Nitrospira sp.]